MRLLGEVIPSPFLIENRTRIIVIETVNYRKNGIKTAV